jgi:arabinofuranosyltransferase
MQESLPLAAAAPLRLRARALELAATAVALAGAVAGYAVFVAQGAFRADGRLTFTLFDDAMVSMTYARNFAEGHGLVWNAGETPVEGYTNFLWTLWLAFLHLLPGPDAHVGLLVSVTGIALLVANALVVRAIARRLAPRTPWLPPVAVAAVALYYPLAYWTLRGTEVGLLAFLTSSAVLLALRLDRRPSTRDASLLAVVLAAGLLTRTDFAVTTAVVIAFLALRRRRTALALAGAAVFVLAAHTAFRLAYYGEPVPNTYYLKVEGADLRTRVTRGLRALDVTAFVHLYAPLLIAGAGLAAAVARRRFARPVLLLAAVVGAQFAYSIYVGGDAWEWMQYSNRYLSTAVPLLLLGAMLALRELARAPRAAVWVLVGAFALVAMRADVSPADVSDLQRWYFVPYRPVLAALLCAVGALMLAHRRLRGTAVAALAVLVVVAPNLDPVDKWLAHGGYHVEDDKGAVRYGLALKANTHPDAVIAVAWAGSIPYFAERRSIDLLGKSDPVIARSHPRQALFHPGHTKWDLDYSLGKLRPDLAAQLVDLSDPRPAGYDVLYESAERGLAVLVREDTRLVDRAGLRSFLQ